MWIAIWLIASAVCVVVLALACFVWIIQPSLEIARAGTQFQEEVGSLTADISRGAARASDRTTRLQQPGRAGGDS